MLFSFTFYLSLLKCFKKRNYKKQQGFRQVLKPVLTNASDLSQKVSAEASISTSPVDSTQDVSNTISSQQTSTKLQISIGTKLKLKILKNQLKIGLPNLRNFARNIIMIEISYF